jgi:hypothetical protein
MTGIGRLEQRQHPQTMKPVIPLQGRAEQAGRDQRAGRYHAFADGLRDAVEGDAEIGRAAERCSAQPAGCWISGSCR